MLSFRGFLDWKMLVSPSQTPGQTPKTINDAVSILLFFLFLNQAPKQRRFGKVVAVAGWPLTALILCPKKKIIFLTSLRGGDKNYMNVMRIWQG